MGKTIFLAACLASELFLLYSLFHFVLELRRGHREWDANTEDIPVWIGSRSVVRFSRERAAARGSSFARAVASSPVSRDAVTSIAARRRA